MSSKASERSIVLTFVMDFFEDFRNHLVRAEAIFSGLLLNSVDHGHKSRLVLGDVRWVGSHVPRKVAESTVASTNWRTFAGVVRERSHPAELSHF